MVGLALQVRRHTPSQCAGASQLTGDAAACTESTQSQRDTLSSAALPACPPCSVCSDVLLGGHRELVEGAGAFAPRRPAEHQLACGLLELPWLCWFPNRRCCHLCQKLQVSTAYVAVPAKVSCACLVLISADYHCELWKDMEWLQSKHAVLCLLMQLDADAVD